jgi:hypothetical protein
MTNQEIVLAVYVIGSLLAFIIGCNDAYHSSKKGKDISQFPSMIAPIALLSWLYIIIYIVNLCEDKNK